MNLKDTGSLKMPGKVGGRKMIAGSGNRKVEMERGKEEMERKVEVER